MPKNESDYHDLSSIVSDLRSQWDARDRLIDEMRALRYMEVDPKVPANIEAEEVRNPLGYTIVERVVGTLVTDAPQITVPPANPDSDVALRAAGKLEKWTSSALHKLARQQGEDVLSLFIESMAQDGHACMSLMYAPQKWAGFPKLQDGQDEAEYNKQTEDWKRGKPLPLAWRWIDPKCVYPEWDELGLCAVTEVDTRSLTSLASLGPKRFNLAKENYPDLVDFSRVEGSKEKVRFVQRWTRNTLTYMVEDVVVHQQKHRYGTPPYIYSMGQTTATRDPGKMGLSILYPLRYLLPYLDRLLSQKATAVRLWGWPTTILKLGAQGPTGQDGTTRSISIEPGANNTLYPDEELSFLVWPGQGPDPSQMTNIIMSLIDKAGLSAVAYGASGGDNSGYAINQLIAASRMKFRPLVMHAESAIESLVCVLWDIVENQIGQTLYVFGGKGKSSGWLGVGPDDISGYRNVDVKLNPLMPTDQYARSSMALNEVRGGLRSIRGAMETIGIEQPEEEMDRILVEKYRSSPPVEQMLIQSAVQKAQLQLAPKEPPPSEILQQMPGMPPALQQAVTQQLQGGGAQGGAPAAGGDLAAQLQQMQAQGMSPQDAIMQLLQQGVPPEAIAQALSQLMPGVSPDQIMAMVQQVMAQMGGGGGQGGQINPNQSPGPGGNATMAAPGVQAAPAPPTPQARMEQSLPRVGPVTRPSGIAGGRAPGVRRTGAE